MTIQPQNKRELSGLNRRAFVRRTLAAAAATVLSRKVGAAASVPSHLVDVNVSLSQWPLRTLVSAHTADLVDLLQHRGVSQGWAGSFDSVLHKDMAAANAHLAEECRRHGGGLLVPFGSVNPKLPDWEEEVRRCADEHQMPGLRLFPNYHGYRLEDPELAALLRLAAARGLIVQLPLLLEDERMMHPLLRVPPVNPAPLPDLIKSVPGLRLVLLNALSIIRGEALQALMGSGSVAVDIATLEGVGGVAALLNQVPLERVLFGSHVPLFYFESAELKLRESALSDEQQAAIRIGNAHRLLRARR
jgi:uncharacterized protein